MTNDFSYHYRIDSHSLETLSRYTHEVPVRVGSLAKELGLNVVVASLPLEISGLIEPSSDGSYTIKVNRFEPKERQRFTIAHEIAHFLLHRDRLGAGIVDSVLYRSKLSSRIEAEANKLAADIIMPRKKINQAITDEKNNEANLVESLAEEFNVSRQAMSIRIDG